MRQFEDFEWTPEMELAELAQQPLPWEHYLHTVVEFDGHGNVWPLDDGGRGGGYYDPAHGVCAPYEPAYPPPFYHRHDNAPGGSPGD